MHREGALSIDEGLLATLKPAKNFSTGATGSIDFDETGQHCIVASPTADAMILYDCVAGE